MRQNKKPLKKLGGFFVYLDILSACKSLTSIYLTFLKMASERCAGCFGTGKYNGSTCSFCSGTGNIWVPDKVDYSQSNTYGKSRGYSKGPSWLDNAFEDNLATIAMIVVWGIFVYKGLSNPETEWYIPFILGFIVGFIVYKLLSGPLRIIGTFLKYVFYLALIVIALYSIYYLISLF